MKKSELYQIIKEEIFSLLKEENVRHYKITYDDNGKEIKKEVLYLDKTYSIKGKNYSKEIPELNLSKNQEIKPANVSEAKKDKSGLPFALAANIVKYGQPQTPKGAKKTDLTKKQEKQVKKTAEKLKKSIKEVQSEDDFFNVLIDMAIKNKIATSKETDSDKFRDALYDVWDEMGFEDYGKTGQGISTSDYNRSLELLSKKLKKSIKENNTPKHKIVAQWMGPDFFLAKKKEETWDDKDYDLFYRLEKMVTTTGQVPKLNENKDNYMFFQNLKTIKEAIDEMLAMDPEMVDMILSNGHDWANDHIATSKDDTEEVYNFLKSKSAALVAEDEKSNLKIGDKVKYENQEWEVEKFLSNGTVRLKHLKGLPSTNVSPEKIAKLQEKKLVGGQKKLDANKNGKIDAEDFKLLKAKKKVNEFEEFGKPSFLSKLKKQAKDLVGVENKQDREDLERIKQAIKSKYVKDVRKPSNKNVIIATIINKTLYVDKDQPEIMINGKSLDLKNLPPEAEILYGELQIYLNK